MQRGMRLFRLAGIDVYLDWSLLIIFVLIASSLGLGVFPQWHPEWSGSTTLITAFVAAVLFLASVVAHEFSHALVGRANGMTVNRITLFIFGGMARIESQPRDWRSEFWMTIVGPITSLALGFIFISLGMTIMPLDDYDPERPRKFLAAMTPLATLLLWLGPVNIILGLFNLVPGFPLDGGRVLRSLVWGLTGDFQRATRYASQGGQLFAWLLIASGVAMILGMRIPILGTGFLNGLWLMLIGWFLNTAAVASYHQMQSRHLLQGVPVQRIMQTKPRTVDPELSLQELVDHYLFQGDQRAYPVVRDEKLEGLITLQEIRTVPRDRWSDTRVDHIMVAARDLVTVGPDDEAAEALELISQRGFNQLPVMEHQRLRGLIHREDLMRWLSLFHRS